MCVKNINTISHSTFLNFISIAKTQRKIIILNLTVMVQNCAVEVTKAKKQIKFRIEINANNLVWKPYEN